jgi:hypothetical protein
MPISLEPLGLLLQRSLCVPLQSSSHSVRMNVSTDNHMLTFAKGKQTLCLLTLTESKKPTTSGRDRGNHIFASSLQSKVPVHALKAYWGSGDKVRLFSTSVMDGWR